MGNNFSTRVQGHLSEQQSTQTTLSTTTGAGANKFSDTANVPIVNNLLYEEWLASNKLFKTAKSTHTKHGKVICKVFFHRDLLDPKVFSEIVKILKRIRKQLTNNGDNSKLNGNFACVSNVVPYEGIEFVDPDQHVSNYNQADGILAQQSLGTTAANNNLQGEVPITPGGENAQLTGKS
ncbi:unnamed protein product, partial [Amoebophrya sp. A120]|eukprot:GSA120T00015774001.1